MEQLSHDKYNGTGLQDPLLYDAFVGVRDALQRSRYLVYPDKFASPPHSLKATMVREYAKRFSLSTFVETGTCYGEVDAQV